MKQRLIILLSLITLTVTLLISGGNFFQSEHPAKERLLSKLIHTGLERWHYSGKYIDDEFSMEAYSEYVQYLDYGKRFLLEEDVNKLRQFDHEIDDELEEGSTEMMTLSIQLLEKRIHQVMEFYPELLAKPFDFTRGDTVEFDNDKRRYCKNEAELKEYWRKILKYRTLVRYLAFLDENDNKKVDKDKKDNNDKKVEKKIEIKDKSVVVPELEKKAREAVLKSYKSYFNRMLQGAEKDSLSNYINSLVSVYDPHTTYFPPTDKETFDMGMSGSFEGIGALLRQEDEYVKVHSIVPGGPSWRGKQLQAEDMILKVAQEQEEPVDIIGMRVTDAVKLIRGKKGTLVRLTVKKPDGQIMEIPIVRDVVILEETFAKSSILIHKKSGKRFGYIHLPGFYNDFQKKDGRTSSEDVRKELETLKSQKVEGVILDLRNNGGGALTDAVLMSGLFIPEGPMVQVKDKQGNIRPLEDPDDSVTYNGPLIILVNNISASASEILSAALQDYNRAIIVGGTHTYGKGTVQAMLNLDSFVSSNPEEQKFGALTITIQKFYRIDGKSIQKKGVAPDIIVPSRFDSLEIGEKHLDHSLNWDTIPAAQFKKWQPNPVATPELIAKSNKRVAENPAFQKVSDYIKKVDHLRKDTIQSLQLSEVLKEQTEIKKEREKIKETEKDLPFFDVIASQKLEKSSSDQLDKLAKERQDQWFKSIKQDLMLGEAINIMFDLISQ